MSYSRPTSSTEPWAVWVLSGLGVQIIGAVIGATAWLGNDSSGFNRHSALGAWLGAIVGVLGFWVMVVGVVALGVKVALGARLDAMPWPDPGAPMSMRVGPRGPSQPDPASLAADSDPFAVHPGDAKAVAEVRRACEMGATDTALRRLINQLARTHGFTDDERIMAEALFVERQRRR
jgi:hypothetical protein